MLVSGCAGDDKENDKKETKPSTPHGYVEGAEESAEQQSRLVLADKESGQVKILDLIDEQTTHLGSTKSPDDIRTDGRFAYLNSSGGASVFDSGSWMVDHGDHVHYYKAKARAVGTLNVRDARHVYSSTTLTAVTDGKQNARILDRAGLENGKVNRLASLGRVAGPVIPLGNKVLVPTEDAQGRERVEVRDRRGERTSTVREECRDLKGAAITRIGAVYGCADGALLITEDDGRISGESIDFDRDVTASQRPEEFHHRSLGSTLTAKVGDEGIWVLDIPKRKWRMIKEPSISFANTAGSGSPVLALTDQGVLKAFDPSSGEETASKKLVSDMPDEKGAPKPVIEVDGSRAYVNDIAAKKVHEIDYSDDLRKARTFSLKFTPSIMVEAGR